MKNLIISARRIKIELYTLLVCFIASNAINIYSIITYKSSWGELLDMWYIVLPLAIALYIAFALIRLLIAAITHLIAKK